MPQPTNNEDQSLRHSLKEFLNLESKAEPDTKFCNSCGTTCVNLSTNFWLDGDADAFIIRLPFCPQCNPEILARTAAVA